MSIISILIAAVVSVILAGLAFTILKFSEPVIDKPVSQNRANAKPAKKKRFGWV